MIRSIPMNQILRVAATTSALLTGTLAVHLASGNADPKNVLTGESAFPSYTNVKPGVWRHITASALPKPGATRSSSNGARVVPRPPDAWPQAPESFKVELYATGLTNPRLT